MRNEASPFSGKCQRCSNWAEVLYLRASRGTINVRLCEHCTDLDDAAPVHRSGRGSGVRNQPNPRTTRAKPDRCWHCGQPTQSRYEWWNRGDVPACGWGHAGMWMDSAIESYFKLREQQPPPLTQEDEEYLKKSLGVIE